MIDVTLIILLFKMNTSHVVDNLSQRFCQLIVEWYSFNKLAISHEDHPLGCYIPKKRSGHDGYVQIEISQKQAEVCKEPWTFDNNKKHVFLHVVAKKAACGSLPKNRSELHVSHLCNQRNCFNHEHLVIENATINNSRKGDHSPYVILEGLGGNGTTFVVVACNHVPQCIMPKIYQDKTKYNVVRGICPSINLPSSTNFIDTKEEPTKNFKSWYILRN